MGLSYFVYRFECLFNFFFIMIVNDEKFNFNFRLSLVSFAFWVSVSDYFVFMNIGLFKLMWCCKDCFFLFGYFI